MKLCYSITGVPYIEFENGNKLIFSTITEDKQKGFKWLVYSGNYTKTICLSGGKKNNKEPKIANTNHAIYFITDMKLSGIPKEAKKCLPNSTVTSLKRLLNEFIKEGYFHRNNLLKLEKLLSSDIFVEEDYLDEDPMGYDECEDDNE